MKILVVTKPSIADYANKPRRIHVELARILGLDSTINVTITYKNKKSSNEDEITIIVRGKIKEIIIQEKSTKYSIRYIIYRQMFNERFIRCIVKENHKMVSHRMMKRRELAGPVQR